MAIAYYLSTPEVTVNTNKLSSNWSLSDAGKFALERCIGAPFLQNVQSIWASTEIAALETAEMIARAIRTDVHTCVHMGDIKRDPSGYMDEEAFEQGRIGFLQRPNENYMGWECARDAQKRITRAVKIARLRHVDGDLLFCGHGGVGSLLMTAFADEEISIHNEQPAQGPNLFAFDLRTNELLFRWTPLETLIEESAVA